MIIRSVAGNPAKDGGGRTCVETDEGKVTAAVAGQPRLRVCVVTSIHLDFDVRIWKHARSLAALGHEVHLVCPWSLPPGLLEGVNIIPFRRVRARWQRPWLIPCRLLPAVRRVWRRCDLVHFHDLDLLPWMAPLSLAKPVVYDVHENYADEMLVRDWVWPVARRPLSFAVRWGQFLLSLLIRNLILVVDSQEEDFCHPRYRQVCIRNLASRALFEEAADDYLTRPPAILFTGAHHEWNGSLVLLEIAERLQQRLPEVPIRVPDRFTGPEFRRRFLREMERRNLRNVHIFPFLPAHEMIHELNQATIAISPNLRIPTQIKAVPTKFYEFMAAGLPIVASDLPGAAETVEGNNAGLLARPEEPDTFVAASERLIQDRELAYRLGRNGQEAFLRKYSWESQMPALEAYYRSILSGTDSGH